MLFDYNVYRNANADKFAEACAMIEGGMQDLRKEKLLIDVDGSAIQVYYHDNKEIRVFDDYEVDAVFVESEVNLDKIFC